MELLADTEWVRPVVWFVCAALIAVVIGFLLKYQKARSQKRYEDLMRQNQRDGGEQ